LKLRTAWIVAAIVAFLFWLGAWWLVWVFARFVPAASAAQLGQVGDMFGAGSALFSAIAVGAVAVVLAFDMTERRKDLEHREREVENQRLAIRPFVVSELDQLRIGNAHRASAGLLNVPMTMRVQLRNHSKDPALNVRLRAALVAPDVEFGHVDASLPLADGSPDSVDLESTLTGGSAETFLERAAGSNVVIRVRIEYSSVSGTHWGSTVDYKVDAKDRAARDVIKYLLENEDPSNEADASPIAGGTSYPLRAKVIPGSWYQDSIRTRDFTS
jgi:hypothetical protein